MLITIIIAIVFFVLLAKALFETILGLSQIAYALFMMLIVAPVLYMMAFVVRMFEKPKPKAVERSVGYAGAMRYGSMK